MFNLYRLFVSILFITLIGCNKESSEQELPKTLFKAPKVIEVNTQSGYNVNKVTEDTIRPIVTDNGAVVVTGQKIPLKGKRISPTKLLAPTVRALPNDNELIKVNAQPNVYNVESEIPYINLSKDSLLSQKASFNNKNSFLLNYKGDTVKTGILLPFKGEEKSCIWPKPEYALPPTLKEGASINIKNLDGNHGMASANVLAILEDKRGNMWFGTGGSGVSMYNGNSFLHFTEKNGLCSNGIKALLEDNKGNIWMGTAGGGLTKFDGQKFFHYTENNNLISNDITALIEDTRGNIWLGTEGGGVSKIYGDSITHITTNEGLNNNYVKSILEDRNGNFWFGTLGGGVNLFDGETFTYLSKEKGLLSNDISDVIQDKLGNIWIATDLGVCKYDGTGIAQFTKKTGLSRNYVWELLEDASGAIWFATDGGGVCKYDGCCFTHITEREGLSTNEIFTILEDKSGNIWLGTYEGGVSMYKSASFVHYTVEEGLSNNYVWPILEDSKGMLWFGTNGGGISVYDGVSFTHYTQAEGLSSDYILAIAEDSKHNIWIGSNGGGVTKFDGKQFTTYKEEQGLSNNTVLSILEDKNGQMWFGTWGGGISRFDGETFTHYTAAEGLSNNVITSILEDAQGVIWIGTYGGGFSKFDGGYITHYTQKEGLSNNDVMSMLVDRSGNVWVCTELAGVNQFNGKYFKHYNLNEGFNKDKVWSISESSYGDIWLSTDKGVTLLKSNYVSTDKNGILKSNVQTFGKQDGLKDLDFYMNSSCIDSKNRIWWGSGKSLTMLDLKEHKTAQQPPIVSLNSVEINEQTIDFRNLADSLKDDYDYTASSNFANYPIDLELTHKNNHLTFHFIGVDWFAPHKVKYSYLMDGLNDQWSKPTNEPKADYRNMPVGEYTFKIRAIGESGEWSEPYSYSFEITPPWYETKLYYFAQTGIMVLLVLLAIFLNRFEKGHEWVIVITFVIVITVFEFFLILVEPYIENFASGVPLVKLLVNIALALSLNPIEAVIRKRVKANN